MWLRHKENLEQGETFVETPTVPEKMIADELALKIVRKADLEKRFDPDVLSDTKRLKESMDQSWDDIINQFNGLLTVNYREEMTKQSPVKYVALQFPMPHLVEQAIKEANQPIQGSLLAGENNMFHQVIVQSYDQSLLKTAIAVSDFNLSCFYYDKPFIGEDFKFGMMLNVKSETGNV